MKDEEEGWRRGDGNSRDGDWEEIKVNGEVVLEMG